MIPFFIAMNAVVKIVAGIVMLFGVLMIKSVLDDIIHLKWLLLTIQFILYAGLLIVLKFLAKKYTNTLNRLFEPRLIKKDLVVFSVSALAFIMVLMICTLVFDNNSMTKGTGTLIFSVITNVLLVAFFEEFFFQILFICSDVE